MQVNDLVPVPGIPAGLREAALRGNLVLFIGAGVSVLAGCPGWGDFADAALRSLVEHGKLSFSELDQVRHLSARVKLSLARRLASDFDIDFRALLHPRPMRDHEKGCRIYRGLFRLGNIFVTTNYDSWLDDGLESFTPTASPTDKTPLDTQIRTMNVVFSRDDFKPSLLSQGNTVVHLHGSILDPNSMVLTTGDYIDHYSAYNRSSKDPKTENRVLTFLEFLFQKKLPSSWDMGLKNSKFLNT